MRRLESAESNAVEGNGTVAAKHVVETRGALFMKTTSQLASIVFAAVAISAASARADVLTLDNDLMQDTANTVIDNGAEPLDESMMNPLPLQTSNGGGIGIGLQVGSPTAITIKFSGAQQTGLVLGLGANFGYGNSVLSLGDMSEADGRIPGSAEGDPGHPAASHERGYDMDIGYYQLGQPNNRLREVCPHTNPDGSEAYHCTGAPTTLDIWRTTLFMGRLMDSPQYLSVGVDGQVAPFVREAAGKLCAAGVLEATSKACSANGLERGPQNSLGRGFSYDLTAANEVGWFYFHLHHMHLSVFDKKNGYLSNW